MRMKFSDVWPMLSNCNQCNALQWLQCTGYWVFKEYWRTLQCTVDSVYCAVHCALCTVYCTITVPCALCNIHCTMCTTLVTVPCALCTVHCTGHWQGGGGGGSVSATSGSFEPRPKLPVSKTVGGKTRPEIYLSPHKWIFAGEIKEFFKIIKRRERFCTKVYLSVRMRFYAKVLKPISGKIAKECKIR